MLNPMLRRMAIHESSALRLDQYAVGIYSGFFNIIF
jgi:hypothetical protein